jgi:hypothetical protein
MVVVVVVVGCRGGAAPAVGVLRGGRAVALPFGFIFWFRVLLLCECVWFSFLCRL